MLMDKILDLSGPIPESLDDFNYLCTSVVREIMDIMDDGEFLYNKSKQTLLNENNPTFDPKNKKILVVYRGDTECEEQPATDKKDIEVGSGSLMEASDYSPAYIVDVTVPAGIGTLSSELTIYPPVDRYTQGKVFWVPYPKFGSDIVIDDVNSLVDDLTGDYAFWTFEMERAFIIRVAMKILHIRLIETNIEEEDTEISQLVSATMASLEAEWNDYKNLLKGISKDDMEKWQQLGGGGR